MTALVILPGLDGTTALLEAFCSRIRQSGLPARTTAYPPDRVLGYPQLESLVRAKLPASEPFVLLGESFSGPLAIRIAARPPANLAGLVLSTTFARSPVPALAPLTGLVRFAPARPPMPLLYWWLLGSWATPPLRSALQSALHTVVPSVLRARAAAAMSVDVSAVLPSIRMPAMHLVASRDRLLGRSAAQLVAHGIPHCRTVTVAGPHLLLQAATEPCALEVADFVSGLAIGNSPARS
ncbi:alpha/beta fold hydrolase [Marilutibacter chinensis]|uniref:Alpha/beta hydrolase n=1 Tax=Marilutibacter chinensis TaxID=2912247 RepID=A0ABS9HR02_9GAMM|nr:alpha/beta hydrolase [Lysobacter chinensis]MCF7221078.1 alpha/beta hydrolase [Lysobacter chinensis]